MATKISAASTATAYRLRRHSCFQPAHESPTRTSYVFHPLSRDINLHLYPMHRKNNLAICVLTKNRTPQVVDFDNRIDAVNSLGELDLDNKQITSRRAEERLAKKKSERETYLIAAIMSSVGITSLAIMAVYYRFSWQTEGEVPITEMLGTFSVAVGAAVGMEFWARWAHRALWHDSLWHMHESHHKPRDGPFELNDLFAFINAFPAIALLAYGFFHKGLVPGLCFGAGLGITVFGMAYMFVHDGLVHRRFPVGPIADVPYLRRVAAAHQIHHSDKFKGVPYGLFLGPKELEEVGGSEELDKEFQRRVNKQFNKSSLD